MAEFFPTADPLGPVTGRVLQPRRAREVATVANAPDDGFTIYTPPELVTPSMRKLADDPREAMRVLDQLEQGQKVAKGFVENMQAGWQRGADVLSGYGGLTAKGGKPTLSSPSDLSQTGRQDMTWYEAFARGVGQFGGDLGHSIVGGLAGFAAGSAIPGIGGAVGGRALAGYGGMALPAGVRAYYLEALEKGEVKDSAEFWDRFQHIFAQANHEGMLGMLLTTAPAAVGMGRLMAGGLGARQSAAAAFGSVGGQTAKAAAATHAGREGMSMVEQQAARTTLSSMQTRAAQLAAEYGAFVGGPALMDGRLPEATEFLDAAIFLGGLKAGMHGLGAGTRATGRGVQKLRTLYEETGALPMAVAADARAEPSILLEMDTRSVPERLAEQRIVSRETARLEAELLAPERRTPEQNALLAEGRPVIEEGSPILGRALEVLTKPEAERTPAEAEYLSRVRDDPIGPEVRLTVEERQRVHTDLTVELKRLGLGDVALALRDRVMGGRADAIYDHGVVTMALDTPAAARAGVLNHEVIHAMRDMGVFSQGEWRALERAAGRWADDARVRGDGLTTRERYAGEVAEGRMTEAGLLEEAIADANRALAEGRITNRSGMLNRFMERVHTFMEAIGNALRGNGFVTAMDVLRAVQTGEIGARVRSTASAMAADAVLASRRINTRKGTIKAGAVLYHGTQGALRADDADTVLYLTDSRADARAYAEGMIPGTGLGAQGGDPRVISFTVADDAKILDINRRVDDALYERGQETVDQAVSNARNEARAAGYDFVWFEHPSVDGGEMRVFVPTAKGIDMDILLDNEGLASRRAPGFYSQLERSIEAAPMRSASPKGWRDYLKGLLANGQVKQAELDAVGVAEYLDLYRGDKLTRGEISEFLAQNGVKVEETVLGAPVEVGALSPGMQAYLDAANGRRVPSDSATWQDIATRLESSAQRMQHRGDESAPVRFELAAEAAAIAERYESGSQAARYAQWQLPGGTNYRELLLMLPAKSGGERGPRGWGDTAGGTFDTVNFRSGHFEQPNILAHTRFNERVDADGKRVLFIEEIQSDWAQARRKYADQNTGDLETALRQVDKRDVPSGPFIGKTEAWVAITLKRMIRYAAENGFDRIAWTTGRQQVERYPESLRAVADNITWRVEDAQAFGPDVKQVLITKADARVLRATIDKAGMVMDAIPTNAIGKNLAELIGKPMAERAVKEESGTIKGQDFTVGGKGMETFYDVIIPNVANDVIKKMGGEKVKDITIESGERKLLDEDMADLIAETPDQAMILGEMSTVENVRQQSQLGFDITPRMAERALEGQPLMSKRAPSEAPSNIPAAYRPLLDREILSHAFPDGIDKVRLADIIKSPHGAIPDTKTENYINFKHVKGPDALKSLYAAISEQFTREIEAGRQSPTTWETTFAQARDLINSDGSVNSQTLRQAVSSVVLQAASLDVMKSAERLIAESTPDNRVTHESSMMMLVAAYAHDQGVGADSARALNLRKAMNESRTTAESILETRHFRQTEGGLFGVGARELSPVDMAKILRTLKDKTPRQFADTVSKMEKATTYEMVIEAWKAGLVSGPWTHVTNLVGTGLYVAAQPLLTALAGARGVIRGAKVGMAEGDRISLREPIYQALGMIAGAKQGLIDAHKAFFELNDVTGKQEVYRHAIPGTAGHVIRTLFRLLSAEDAFISSLVRRGEMTRLAVREAVSKGLDIEGRELVESVNSMLDGTHPEAARFNGMVEESVRKFTFNTPLGPKGASIQNMIQQNKLHFIAPFVRTPLNILEELVRNSPLAPFAKSWRDDVAAGGVRADRALAEATMGSMVAGLVFLWAIGGDDEGKQFITGAGHPDPGKRRAGAAAGIQPYSIRIGDTWYNYQRIQPFGTLIGMVADAAEVWDAMSVEQSDKVWKMVQTAFANAITNQTFLQGVTGFARALDPQHPGTGDQLARQFVASLVPMSGLMGQTAGILDPYVREVNSILDAVQNKIPGLREDLLPKLDIYGEPIEMKDRLLGVLPVTETQQSFDKVRTETVRLGVSVAPTPKKIHVGRGTGKFGEVEMTPEQRHEYHRVSGEFAMEQLSKIVESPGWDATPKPVKVKIFQRVYANAHRMGSLAALPPEDRQGILLEAVEQMQEAMGQQ